MRQPVDWSLDFFPLVSAIALAVGLSMWLRKSLAHRKSYPPGPWTRALPFIGSAISVDFESPYLTYTKWAKLYGPIVYTRMLGDDMVLLSNEKLLKPLTEGHRSTIYASRLHYTFLKRFDVDYHTAMIPYGTEWRQHRSLLHQALRPESIEEHQGLFMQQAKTLVLELLDAATPENLGELLKRFAASTALNFTYGYKAQHDDPVINATKELATSTLVGSSPETVALIQKCPFTEYIPGFFLRMSFIRKLVATIKDTPYEHLKQELTHASETYPAMVYILKNQAAANTRLEASEQTLKNVAATIHISAIDNIAATLQTFILAMTMFPGKQQRAQAEIDRVIGSERLPTLEDRPSLPYVEAVICECLRWHPTSPTGVAHYTTEDDILEDYYIPKGSLIKFNTWAVSRACDDPGSFQPERHLLPDGEISPDSRISSGFLYGNFGFGRRICPGRIYTDSILWAAFAQILATLTISGPGTTRGKKFGTHDAEYEGSLTAHPKIFQHDITVGSPSREALLRAAIR